MFRQPHLLADHPDPDDHARYGDRRPLADLDERTIELIWRQETGGPPPRRDSRRPR